MDLVPSCSECDLPAKWCGMCTHHYHKDYRRKNSVALKAKQKIYFAANRQKIRQASKEKHLRNKADANAKMRENYRSNPQPYKDRATAKNLRNYGLTPQTYAEMLAAQNSVCKICGLPSERALCVDHCHHTGVIRGLLCLNCNAGIGNLKDDTRLVARAVLYLEGKL